MATDSEITELFDDLETSYARLNDAHVEYAANVTRFQEALREKADAIVENLQESGRHPSRFTYRHTSVRGWTLINHPATVKQPVWPAGSDGFVLLYDLKKSFWFIERGWNHHNLSVEATGEIKEMDTDTMSGLKFIWELLKVPSEVKSS